jgi:hypothetical protein
MTTADLLRYAAIVAGYLLAFARLNDKARPLWQFLPAWAQPVMPALVVVIPDLALGLQKGVSVEDVLASLVTAGGALLIALRGAVPAKHYEQLSSLAKSEIAAVRSKDKEPPTKKPGTFPPVVGLLLLGGALAFAPIVTACGSNPAKDPAATAAQARNIARVGYVAGVKTVEALEEARIVWMRAQQSPTPETILIAERISLGLHAATDALTAVKPWLETGEGEAEAKRQLREALESARGVAALLLGAGGAVPKPLTDGLDAALALLGSGQ